MVDLAIWLAFLVACGGLLALIAKASKRAPVQQPAPGALPPVGLRLADDHRRRVAGTHVSAVRASNPRVAQLSPVQKHWITEGKKKR